MAARTPTGGPRQLGAFETVWPLRTTGGSPATELGHAPLRTPAARAFEAAGPTPPDVDRRHEIQLG